MEFVHCRAVIQDRSPAGEYTSTRAILNDLRPAPHAIGEVPSHRPVRLQGVCVVTGVRRAVLQDLPVRRGGGILLLLLYFLLLHLLVFRWTSCRPRGWRAEDEREGTTEGRRRGAGQYMLKDRAGR